MKKIFTFAFLAALSTSFVEAQVLKYGAEAGETAPDTVNWYGDWVDAGGTIEFGNSDAATGSGCVYVNTPEEAGNANDWERVLKFDGLQIKANTNYRVRVSAKAPESAVLGVALMCGDENCDMPFVLPTENGYYSQKKDLSGFNDYDYATKAAIFRYTTDAYQQEIYPNIKADDKNPLGANRFLRLTVKSVGEYNIDDVIVEEATIAACYNSFEAIKVDFGFSTNISQLVKDNGGNTIMLDNSCAKVKVNGAEVAVMSVELHSDGYLYVFPEVDLTEDDVVSVSFDATGSGIKYAGTQTPGDGLDVPSFTDEASFLDENIDVISEIWTEPKLVSSSPADGSFELDEDINEFSFTFDRDINLEKAGAQINVNGKNVTLKNVSEGKVGRTAKFKYEGGQLSKNSYTIELYDVESAIGIEMFGECSISFETGKVSVAGIEYTNIATYFVEGENGNASTNWTSYRDEVVWEATGSDQRTFVFPESGKYTAGFYLSQRGDESASLTYGEKEAYPFALPAGDVQVTILASAWQSNSGSFLYELQNGDHEIIASGSGAADIHQADQNTAANEVSKISFNVENCKAGNYILKLTTNTGGFGNAIIVWGVDVKTYVVGQGETADNQLLVDGSFTDVENNGVPKFGTGWHVYGGEPGDELQKPGSVAGQRTRFFTGMTIANLPNAFYNRNLGGDAFKWRLTYGETTHADGSGSCVDDDDNPVEEKALEFDVARHNFSWYICNWKGDENTYYFKILDEEGAEVYSREDVCTVNCNGSTSSTVEAQKVDFSWTPKSAGKYTLVWYMTGESMAGNIKVEKMGSLAVYWRNQLNDAIAAAEEERANASDEQYAGATRDALDKAITEAKTVTYHTGAEYTAVIDGLAQYVKDMAARRQALADYDSSYGNLVAQTASMEETKYAALDSYKQAVGYVEKYDGVAGYTIDNEALLPLVSDMQTLYTLNNNLMASNTGVAVLTDQVMKLANEYIKLDEIVNGDESTAFFDDVVIAADEAVVDDQKLASTLKKLVTATLYKAINKGYDFTDLEDPNEEPSEDNPYVPSALDLSGFIRNSVFYTLSAKNQPVNQAESDGTCPGWTFDAPGGYAADWGWGGWSGNNQPVAPLNVANSQVGTRWGTDLEVWQLISEIPVGIYSIGGEVCDRSNVGEGNVLKDGCETLSYIYVKQAGAEDIKMTFDISNIGDYYGNTETLIEDVTVAPSEGALTGAVTLGAVLDVEGSFAAIDNAKIKMSAKHPTFDYAAAAATLDNEIAIAIKDVEDSLTDAAVVKTQYFDLSGKKVLNANKGIFIRIQTMSDGSQRASKVLRK